MNKHIRFYDRAGEPISVDEYARLYLDSAYVRVERTEVSPGVEVSTVWLGLNHSMWGGPPLIFETLVFGGPLDGQMRRYATEEFARAGHARVVAEALAASVAPTARLPGKPGEA